MAGRSRKPDGTVLTITALGRQFGLARSTLLHYDKLGLLKPTASTAAGYRQYGPAALARLKRIVQLRAAGLSLESIRNVLDSRRPLAEALEQQVLLLNRQMQSNREQLRVASELLSGAVRPGISRAALTKQAWTAMFRAIGLSDDDMHAWHCRFEQDTPEAHQRFLESLGLGAAEVKRIRKW
jgi:DNA-binding transcriptional MerR regulator